MNYIIFPLMLCSTLWTWYKEANWFWRLASAGLISIPIIIFGSHLFFDGDIKFEYFKYGFGVYASVIFTIGIPYWMNNAFKENDLPEQAEDAPEVEEMEA